VTVDRRGAQHDTDILLRQVNSHVADLRFAVHPNELALAERLAVSLRELIRSTVRASAVDRARVRAAVHYFVLRHDARHARLPARPLRVDQRVVNEIVRDLGREDLLVDYEPIAPRLPRQPAAAVA
jgi:hypothetical protein